nr:tRNA isopentenyl-2-thiomethyl-A-37 hydroxylase MiaE [Aliiglaciecola lipolytica]
MEKLLLPIKSFLMCETPNEWISEAVKKENLAVLLTDHLICELKAGQTAMWLIKKYAADKQSGQALQEWFQPFEKYVYRKEGSLASLGEHSKLRKTIVPKSNSLFGQDFIDKMVLLIKEELHHFYQVLEIMQAYGIEYNNITASRYAKGMMQHLRTHEPAILVDKLICGAYIEARSCERFAKLAPYLDEDLSKFYVSLLRSEARHFEDYLSLAQQVAREDISQRIMFFGEIEAKLISSKDSDFKFHSGRPHTV